MLFTDIEGSTVLAERLDDRWPGVLADHNRLLRGVFSAHGGRELGSEGDALFFAFSTAGAAASATATAQRALADHAWPGDVVVRVRMGLHTGEPIQTEDGYVGLDMHRAARVTAAAHGGQVLVSQRTRELLPKDPDGFVLRDLGDHRLKDLSEPIRLFQILIDGIPDDLRPPRTIRGRATNLPAEPTPLLGRQRELDAARMLLLEEQTRMVTLTGPGGTGKTRLALQVAADVVDGFPDGVFCVLLAAIADPELVPLEIARVLGVEEQPAVAAAASLETEIGDRPILLVLDNFEHVRAAAGLLTDLLAACRNLKLLVTSREPLRVGAERQFPVPPLSLPSVGQRLSAAEADAYEAVMLFAERARAVRPDFRLTDETASVVAAICIRLDGLPLAIELAAAWSKVLSPIALLRRLERRLELPAAGRTDLPARQSTLRQAIAWSYDLLTEEERRLHARLSVFVGGCTIETAERVLDPHGESGFEILEGVASLVDRSLVRESEDAQGEPRFTMLGTIREYAREHLGSLGDEVEFVHRHALEFAALAEQADAGLRTSDQALWFRRLETEHDNLRAALESSLESGDRETALRLGAALGWFWYAHGHALEGCSRLSDLLARTDDAPDELRARPMYALGVLLDQRGDPGCAADLVERSLAVFRRTGEDERVAQALNSLGTIRRATGELASARALLEESIAVRRRIGDEPGAAGALSNLGIIAFEQGDLDGAETRFRETLALDRSSGNEWGAGIASDNLAAVAIERGELGRARELVHESLACARRLGDGELLAFALEKSAVLAAREADVARAGRLLGAADSLRESIGIGRSQFDADWLDRRLTPAAGGELGAARAVGRTLSVDAAFDEATAR